MRDLFIWNTVKCIDSCRDVYIKYDSAVPCYDFDVVNAGARCPNRQVEDSEKSSPPELGLAVDYIFLLIYHCVCKFLNLHKSCI